MLSYINNKLEGSGYDGCTVQYQFNYEDTDGVAWFGQVDMLTLAHRLITRGVDKAAIIRAIKKGAVMSICEEDIMRRNGLTQTMYVSLELPVCELSVLEHTAIRVLKHFVELDLVKESKQIEASCFGLIESNLQNQKVIRRVQKGGYEIVIREIPDSDSFDDLPLMRKSVVDEIIAGKLQRHGLMAEVRTSGVLVGCSKLYGFLKGKGRRNMATYREYCLSMVNDALQQANSRVSEV